jgi:hypothetical protein
MKSLGQDVSCVQGGGYDFKKIINSPNLQLQCFFLQEEAAPALTCRDFVTL